MCGCLLSFSAKLSKRLFFPTCEAAVPHPHYGGCLLLVTRPRKVAKPTVTPASPCRWPPTGSESHISGGPLPLTLLHCPFKYDFLTADISPYISSVTSAPGSMFLPRTFQNTSEPLLQASPPVLPASLR